MRNPSRKLRYRKIGKHHLLPKSRGGKSEPWNIVNLEQHVHDGLHYFMGNHTPQEMIAILQRLIRMKEAQKKRLLG